jgi:putative transposase
MFLYGSGFKTTNQKEYIFQKKTSEFIIVDETQIEVGNYYFWLWVARELNNNKSILDIYLSAAERNMFVAQNFIRNLVNKYGKHPVSTDIWWYLVLICL